MAGAWILVGDMAIGGEGVVRKTKHPAQVKTTAHDGEIPIRGPKRESYRSAILDAALDVFSEVGYQSAQIREIAKRAGVAVGTIYNLYQNKECLYQAIMDDHAFDIAAAFSELFQSNLHELELLYRYIELKARLTDINEKALRLYFLESGAARFSPRAGLASKKVEAYNNLLITLAEIIQRAIEKGQLRRGFDPFDLAVALGSITNGFSVLQIEYPGQHSFRSKVNMIFELMFSSLASREELQKIMNAEKET